MNSRVPPTSNGPTDSDHEQPQRAPLGQWLNNRLAPTPALPQAALNSPQRGIPAQTAESVEEIHRRLDGITRQIDQMAQRRAAGQAQPAAGGLANQLNDAISRLDMRLSHIAPTPDQPQADPRQAAAAPAPRDPGYRDSPPLAPNGMDAAIAEIAARRNDLTGQPRQNFAPSQSPQYYARPPVHMPQAPAHPAAPQAYVAAPPSAPAMPQVDLSGIERQLHTLTERMDSLRTPDHLDQSIAAFRQDLSDIRQSLTEALPRRAIESLEAEIRSLAGKIEKSRDTAADTDALSSIEQALNDIYNSVKSLTPAEQLAGYDTAIQNLSAKVDLLVRANPNSNIVEQLEDAIAALRGIASNVASNDAVSRLNDHLQALAEKVDHLAETGSNGMLSALEQRIALLTTAMETRTEAPASDSDHLESAIRALSERIDRLSAPADNSAAMMQVEQRIAYLLERIETAQPAYPANFSRIEESLMDVLRQLDQQRTHFAAVDRAAPMLDPSQSDLADAIRRELSDVRYSQTETDRRTQDSLEAVQNTLSHVVDRLSMIEGDLRRVQAPPPPPEPPRSFRAEAGAPAMSPLPATIRPELPNPARAQSIAAYPPAMQHHVEPLQDDELFAPVTMAQRGLQREPIDPNLPPDFPLEPGARNRGDAFAGQPEAPFGQDETAEGGQTNFIAAARRAAKASMEAPQAAKPGRISVLTQAARNAAAKATAKTAKTKSEPVEKAAAASGTSKVRSVLVGVSVVVIVLGTFKMALALIDSDPAAETSAKPTLTLPAPGPKAEAPAPLLTSPTAVQQHSFAAPVPQLPVTEPVRTASADVTGTILMPSSPPVTASVAPTPASISPPAAPTPVSDAIPEALAGPSLRAAAQRGDASAAYEIASRYADGKGVTANYDEAAKWYERAAQGGVVPAMFRLGSILEKGLGGKKDPETARHYYTTAAERGHAKAMHNLAVMDADGGGKGPNYKSATGWFKKAAERGVADSQYNLAILYARGIGVEQNLAESYKWFSLAAAQGDADAGRKRDDIAKRLDQQSLAAAKLAIQTFSPDKQPDDVLTVATPAGGWDSAPAAATVPAKKPAKSAAKQGNPVR